MFVFLINASVRVASERSAATGIDLVRRTSWFPSQEYGTAVAGDLSDWWDDENVMQERTVNFVI